jgi:hypothetical protein
MPQALTLEVKCFHFALNARMGMMIALVVKCRDVFLTKTQLNHGLKAK